MHQLICQGLVFSLDEKKREQYGKPKTAFKSY